MFQKHNFVTGSFYLYEQFKNDAPFVCGKIGNCELMCIYNYFLYQHKQKPVEWFPNVVTEIFNNAGVFPQTEQSRLDFIAEIVNCLPDIDCLAWWSPFNKDFEGRFIKKYSPNCTLIESQSLEPYYSGIPWTDSLKNKKVLVISPFIDTIKQQYKIKNALWADNRVLPDFELLTLKHPHSPGIEKESKYTTWSDLLEDIKVQMDKIQYDVALIGTGASSLPLATHAKRCGKKAIHLGGPLQILFGIKGKRWDSGNIGKFFYNENWVRPKTIEIPFDFKTIEDGCYW